MIDIMIPFWGDPDLLMSAVDSVRRQDDPAWSLTVIDDWNPVSPAERLAVLGDDRIHYRRNERRLGITGNFRRCIELATAEFVVVMGCDDLLLPNYVATIHAAARDFPTATIIQPGVVVIDEHDQPVQTLRDWVKAKLVRPRATGPFVLQGEAAAASLLKGDWLYWPSLAFRRSAMVGHDFDDYAIVLDLALVIDLILDGGVLLWQPAVCFCYRRHRTSLSGSAGADGSRFEEERHYLKRTALTMKSRAWPRAARRASFRLMSRLDALTLVPGAILGRQWRVLARLIRHVVS